MSCQKVHIWYAECIAYRDGTRKLWQRLKKYGMGMWLTVLWILWIVFFNLIKVLNNLLMQTKNWRTASLKMKKAILCHPKYMYFYLNLNIYQRIENLRKLDPYAEKLLDASWIPLSHFNALAFKEQFYWSYADYRSKYNHNTYSNTADAFFFNLIIIIVINHLILSKYP